MKKTLVLIVMLVMQSLICLTFACDSIPTKELSKSEVKASRDLASIEQYSDSTSDHPEQNHVECNQCNFCLHLVVIFVNVDIDFISKEISSQNFSAHDIYRQPFINQYKKPPIKA